MIRKLHTLLNSENDAFRIVLLCRLTPVPFALQNSLFALSHISTLKYLQASIIGLFPCQIATVYLGSTVRSMEEVCTM